MQPARSYARIKPHAKEHTNNPVEARGVCFLSAPLPLGLQHCVFQPCLSFQNGIFHITQNSTNSIEGVLFPLIVN